MLPLTAMTTLTPTATMPVTGALVAVGTMMPRPAAPALVPVARAASAAVIPMTSAT
jgi:hypothetical protein